MTYQVARITGAALASFEQFTFAGLRSLLTGPQQNRRIVAVGASLSGDPVGLALAEMDTTGAGGGELRSLALAADHRGIGLGKRLLQTLEAELKLLGCPWVGATFPDDNTEAVRLFRLFRSAGWAEPSPLRLLCKATAASLNQAPWTGMSYSLRFGIFPWKELTSSDRADILDRQSRRPWFPDTLSPFRAESRIHPDASVGLRAEGRVIGWCIGLEDAPGSLWVDSLFVSRETATRGGAVPLLACFLRRLPATGIVDVVWQVDRSNAPMVRFTERRLKPCCHYLRTTTRTHKIL